MTDSEGKVSRYYYLDELSSRYIIRAAIYLATVCAYVIYNPLRRL